MKRNGTIEFFRFVFSILILMLHYSKDSVWNHARLNFRGGAIGVEFFFLVSGWLFAKSLDRIKETDQVGGETLRFMRRKIGGLYPEFIFAWIHSFVIIHILKHSFDVSTMVREVLECSGELLLIRTVGLGTNSYVRGSWYLSAMFLAMLILFPIAIRNKDRFFYVICPLTSIFLFGILFTQFGKIRSFQGMFLGVFNSGLMRGIAEISLGCICYKLSMKLASLKLGTRLRTLLGIVEISCYLFAVLFGAYLVGHMESRGSELDFPVLMMLAIAVAISFSGQPIWSGLFNNPVSYFLGKLSFPLYLGHGIIVKILNLLLTDLEGMARLSMFFILCVVNAGLIILWARLLRKYIMKGG